MLVALTVAAGFAIAATDARARDMAGKGGVGLLVPTSELLGNTPALSLRYWRRSWALEAAIGSDWFRVSAGDDDVRRLHAGFGVSSRLIDTRWLSAGVGARLWTQYSSHERVATANGQREVTIENDLGLLAELLLVAEYFVSDHLGISAAVGPSWYVVSSFRTNSRTDSGVADLLGQKASRGGSLFELGGRYSGALGMAYYF